MKNIFMITFLSLLYVFISISGYAQNSKKDECANDSIKLERFDFMSSQIETLKQINSLQSNSINNLNLMIQIISMENRQIRNEIDSLHRTLEALDLKKIRRKAARKQKSEPLKL